MEHPLTLARKAANLSQTALAVEAEVSRQSVIRIEKGKQTPSMDLAARIITALKRRDVELSADVFLPGARQ